MDWKHPRIAVIGAGAVGGYYGARLAQHGQEVHFLLRGDYRAVKERGWRIESCDGDFELKPGQFQVYDDPGRMPKADLVLIALKTTVNDQYQPLIAPLLKESTVLLTLQNGLGNEEQLAELFGPQRVLGGLAFVCINRIEPGRLRHSDHGLIQLGELAGAPVERTRAIAKLLRDAGISVELLSDLRYGRWEKLLWNVPFNGLGAALDLATDALLASAEGEQLVRQIMLEVVQAAASQGVRLDPGLIDQKIAATRTMGAYRSSMQIDRQLGRPLEIEAILARPLAVARAAGLSLPAWERVCQLAQVVDGGRRGQ